MEETPVWRFDLTEHGKGLYYLFATEFDRIWHRGMGSEMLCAARVHDQADGDEGDHALQVGAFR